MPGESLVPGYKLVETFGPDSEYETRPSVDSEGNEGGEEVEEEVEYVTLEISGIADVDPNLLTSYRLIGVDTPTPFLQLSSSGTIFKGRHHKLLGTELLFSHAQGDTDPSARRLTLLGTTEQRIVFVPVEIRNPACSSSTLRPASKTKTPGKESASNPKKGKKKTNIGAGGIEEVAGSLSVGVLKSSSALVDRDPAAELGPNTCDRAAGKKKDNVAQDDGGEGVYATEEDGAGEGGSDGTLEVDVGGGEDAGGGGDTNAGLLQWKKRRTSRNDTNKGEGSGNRSTQGPTTTTPTPAIAPEPNAVEATPPIGSGIPMAIDPALEALQVPNSQSSPQISGSGTGI